MPPTVAQTAPAFADPAAEASFGFGLNANAACRAEHEDRRVLVPPLPPVARDLLDELHGYKNLDARALFQQLDDEWTRRVLLPAAPGVLEDWTWSLPAQAGFKWLFAPQTTEQDLPSLLPNAPAAFDDGGESSRDFTEKHFWLDGDVLLGLPFTPSTAWLDDAPHAFAGSPGTLAAMLVLDEFVNAPSGGAFGSPPRGRSARFGFSISSFR